MPGAVGLAGLIALGIFWIASGLVVAALLRLIFKRSRGVPLLIGCAISGLASVALAWEAFGYQSYPIEPAEAMSRFPDLVPFHAMAEKGHYWQDGLSDGEYYVLKIPPDQMARLAAVLAASREEWTAAEIVGRPLLSAPGWYVGKTCERHFGFVMGHAPDTPYLERFTLHLCIFQNKPYADWERIRLTISRYDIMISL